MSPCAGHTKRRGRHLPHASRRRAIRWKVGERDNWTCQICGCAVDPTLPMGHAQQATMDHVVPFALGGRYVVENLRLACHKCNQKLGRQLHREIGS